MITGISEQGRGARIKHARVISLRHICVSGVNVFPNTTLEIYFAIDLKLNTIFDEYKKYWNNDICLSNQVNANAHVRVKKAPGTRIRFKTVHVNIMFIDFEATTNLN